MLLLCFVCGFRRRHGTTEQRALLLIWFLAFFVGGAFALLEVLRRTRREKVCRFCFVKCGSKKKLSALMKRKDFEENCVEPKRQRRGRVASVIENYAKQQEVDCFRSCVALPPNTLQLRWEELSPKQQQQHFALVDYSQQRVYVELDAAAGTAIAFDTEGTSSRDIALSELQPRPTANPYQLVQILRIVLRQDVLKLEDWLVLSYICQPLRTMLNDRKISPWLTRFKYKKRGRVFFDLPPADMAFLLLASRGPSWQREVYFGLTDAAMSTWKGLRVIFLCLRRDGLLPRDSNYRFVSNLFTPDDGLPVIKFGSPNFRQQYLWYSRRHSSVTCSLDSQLCVGVRMWDLPVFRFQSFLRAAVKLR